MVMVAEIQPNQFRKRESKVASEDFKCRSVGLVLGSALLLHFNFVDYVNSLSTDSKQ